MNIILISDDRLKVTLTEQDLDGYGIRLEDIDYDNTETKRVFWTILDRAKCETGFDAAQSRIFIQIYPDTRGGCEMYVSRIGEKRNGKSGGERVRCAIDSGRRKRNAEYVYRFENLEYLIKACRALTFNGFSGRSSAYTRSHNHEAECYLIFRADPKWQLYPSEYGENCVERYAKWSVTEHCAPICEGNAAEILGKL